jgi:hypothetical protein
MARQQAIIKAREPHVEAKKTTQAVQRLQIEDMIVEWQ